MKRYVGCSLIMRLARSKLILYAFCVSLKYGILFYLHVSSPLPKNPITNKQGTLICQAEEWRECDTTKWQCCEWSFIFHPLPLLYSQISEISKNQLVYHHSILKVYFLWIQKKWGSVEVWKSLYTLDDTVILW